MLWVGQTLEAAVAQRFRIPRRVMTSHFCVADGPTYETNQNLRSGKCLWEFRQIVLAPSWKIQYAPLHVFWALIIHFSSIFLFLVVKDWAKQSYSEQFCYCFFTFCTLDRFTKTFFWNFQKCRAVLWYILIDKQMLEWVFCSNNIKFRILYKAKYLGQSCLN